VKGGEKRVPTIFRFLFPILSSTFCSDHFLFMNKVYKNYFPFLWLVLLKQLRYIVQSIFAVIHNIGFLLSFSFQTFHHFTFLDVNCMSLSFSCENAISAWLLKGKQKVPSFVYHKSWVCISLIYLKMKLKWYELYMCSANWAWKICWIKAIRCEPCFCEMASY